MSIHQGRSCSQQKLQVLCCLPHPSVPLQLGPWSLEFGHFKSVWVWSFEKVWTRDRHQLSVWRRESRCLAFPSIWMILASTKDVLKPNPATWNSWTKGAQHVFETSLSQWLCLFEVWALSSSSFLARGVWWWMAAPGAAPAFAQLDSESGSEESNGSKGSKVQDFWKQKLLVPAVFTLYVVTKSLDKIFIYRVRKSMAHYSTVLMTIYWPPGVCLACFVFLLMLNTVKRALGRPLAEGPEGKAEKGSIGPLSWFSPFSEYASSQGRVPQRWFALIAFCDQINATFSSPPAVFIPAVMLTPLYNSVVLWTALISFFYLGTRFQSVHLAGICLILCSCFVGVMVELQGPAAVICDGLDTASSILQDDTLPIPIEAKWKVNNATDKCVSGLPPYKDANGKFVYIPLGTLAGMYFFLVATVIPYAFVNVYKQKKLKQVNLDVAWGFFWQSAWQVLFGLIFIPASWIPWPTPTGINDASASSFWTDLADSWTCFMGTNPKAQVTSCSAEPAWAWFATYLFFNVFFNLCLMWLIKHMSSTWAAIGTVLCGNLGGFFSQFEIFGGKSAQVLSMEQWMALILSTIALWVYNTQDEEDKHGQSVYGQQDRGDHRYDTHNALGLESGSHGLEETAQEHTTLWHLSLLAKGSNELYILCHNVYLQIHSFMVCAFAAQVAF